MRRMSWLAILGVGAVVGLGCGGGGKTAGDEAAQTATGEAGARVECPPRIPEGMLDCLSRAYAERDIQAYVDLLAPDFQFVFAQGDSESGSWGRAADSTGTAHLFADRGLASVSLTYAPDFRVTRGEGAGVWRVEGVEFTVTVQDTAKPAPHTRSATSHDETLVVARAGAGENAPFRIVKWLSRRKLPSGGN